MKSKMVINTHLSATESKKQAKQKNRDRVMDRESILMLARWEWGVGEWVKR